MALLEVKDLDKTFIAGDRPICGIEKLTLSIEENEFVSIVGPSGCGKSTFLHIVGGFEPASGGAVRLDGRPIGRPGPDRGMMFQELSLFPWLTAIENVCWPLEMKGMPKPERLAKARDYLDVVHLSRYADFYPAELSGGMKQRVALARLFALDSRSPADGRAVRRARFADPRTAAGGTSGDLAPRPQDRVVRHPRHRRSDLPRHARARVHGAAGPHQGRYHACRTSTAPAITASRRNICACGCGSGICCATRCSRRGPWRKREDPGIRPALDRSGRDSRGLGGARPRGAVAALSAAADVDPGCAL